MPQTGAQLRLAGIEEYLWLRPMQKRVVWLSIEGLNLTDDEIRKCCIEARSMNAIECNKVISAYVKYPNEE